jgi:hypothetical protein
VAARCSVPAMSAFRVVTLRSRLGTVVMAADPAPTPSVPAARTWVARSKVDLPASWSYIDDGALHNDNEAHEGRRWKLLAFQVVT